MSDVATERKISRLFTAPWMGFFFCLWIIMMTPIAHSATVLMFLLPDGIEYAVAALVGALGVVLVYKGLRQTELTASVMGWFGANLIWIFWVEIYLEHMSHFNKFPGVIAPASGMMPVPTEVFPGSLVFLQQTGLFTFIFLILFGFNKDTRCRMFLWFRRNLGLKVGTLTLKYTPQYARIAALETFAIIWFIYLLNLWTMDPRIFPWGDTGHWISYVTYFGMWGWGFYLLFFKLIKIREIGLAFRYAIPTGSILWYGIEVSTQMQIFGEFWLTPWDHQIIMSLFFVIFCAAFIPALRAPLPASEAKALAKAAEKAAAPA